MQKLSILRSADRRSNSPPPRVFVIAGEISADSMEWHVMDSLRELGAPAELFTTGLRFKGLGRVAAGTVNKIATFMLREPERLNERQLVNRVAKFVPDLILMLLGNQLSPKSVARLRQVTKAPIVCWCQDHLGTMGRQYLLGAGYDAIFLKDRYMLALFSSMVRSTRFYYLPEACNPRVHRSLELSPADQRRYGCEVAIYGSLYYYRQEILRQLGEFDLKIWGYTPSWFVSHLEHRRAGGDVVMAEKVRAVRAARIALNTLHYAEVDSLNCRAFELAGCGAFQLITARDVLAEHFVPGVELDSFASIEELIEKIRHYLRHPEHTQEVARRGQLRAHTEHTYERRLSEIFRISLNRNDTQVPPLECVPVAAH
jgi:spore maturation protein CgeB